MMTIALLTLARFAHSLAQTATLAMAAALFFAPHHMLDYVLLLWAPLAITELRQARLRFVALLAIGTLWLSYAVGIAIATHSPFMVEVLFSIVLIDTLALLVLVGVFVAARDTARLDRQSRPARPALT